ncbi:MAG: diaminopimelate decarboxylase [Streptosporangiaceae bacterium]|jgi:diaminopimelate decarboxylase|nr:lysA [Streptosporangiaceae bacterium]MDX6431248.1 diaminopimelate decarboxylase [Streptosporangiaceae bacterium]
MRGSILPFAYSDGALCVDGTPLAETVAGSGTPAYVYSLDAMVSRHQAISDAYAPLGAQVYYSVKANSNLSVLRALGRVAAGFDVVSGGELTRALAAGMDPARISFAGVGKTDDELGLAVKHGLIVHVESAEELHRLQAVAAGLGTRVRFGLRINPGITVDTLVHMQTGSDRAKFGVPAAEAGELLARSAAGHLPNLDPVGVHMHVGSQIPNPADMVAAAEVLLGVLETGRSLGLSRMRRLDLGGGFPVDYGDSPGPLPQPADFAAALAPVLAGREVELVLEPGRWITGPAGVLVARVLFRKQTPAGRMLVLDTGMHHFARPALYQAIHRILPLRAAPSAGFAEVVGPICESTDRISARADLPELAPGDLVAIMDAGAYGMVLASNYNSQPRPPELVVEGGRARVARRRETWQDLMALED